MLIGIFPISALAGGDDGHDDPGSGVVSGGEPAENEDSDIRIVVTGGTVTSLTTGEELTGAPQAGDILLICVSEQEGRVFKEWRTDRNAVIPDASFQLYVGQSEYFYPVFEDTMDYPFSDWSVLAAGGCENGNVLVRTNTVGDIQYKLQTYYNGHNYSMSAPVDEHTHVSTCEICGDSFEAEHNFTVREVLREPTHTEPGLVKVKCTDCDYVTTISTDPVPDHVFDGASRIVEPSENGNYGIRAHKCRYCDEEQEYWYLEPDLKAFLDNRYVNFLTTEGQKVTHNEQYYNFTDEQGRDVYVWALQYGYVYSGTADNGQSFVFMFKDDHDPSTRKPIYLTQSKGTYTPEIQWGVYAYGYTFEDWEKLLDSPDFAIGSDGNFVMGNTMSARASSLHGYHSFFADAFNKLRIPTSLEPDSFLTTGDQLGYWEIDREHVPMGYTWTDANDVLHHSVEDGTTYRKKVSDSAYVYVSVDNATGCTFAVDDGSTYFRTLNYQSRCTTMITDEEYEGLDESTKHGYCCPSELVQNVVVLFQTRNALSSSFSLDEPTRLTGVRILCGGNCEQTGSYVSYTNNSRMFPVTTTTSNGTVTLKYTPAENRVFDGWEMWDFETRSWTLFSTLTQISVNTPTDLATGPMYIRCATHRPEGTGHITVTGGTFIISNNSDRLTSADLPLYTDITLIPGRYYDGDLVFSEFVDANGETVSQTYTVTGDADIHPVYKPMDTSVCAMTNTDYAQVKQVLSDSGDGGSAPADDEAWTSYLSLYRLPHGTVVHLTTQCNPEEDEMSFAGWYLEMSGEYGTTRELISKDLDVYYKTNYWICQDVYITAVWLAEGETYEEFTDVYVKGGFVRTEAYSPNETYNYYSTIRVPQSSSLIFFDDPTDGTDVWTWELVYRDWNEEEVHQNVQIDLYRPETYYYLSCPDTRVSVTGMPSVPCEEEHTYLEWPIDTLEPTHLKDGYEVYICSECGHRDYRVIPHLEDHTFGDWEPNAEDSFHHYRYCECGEFEKAGHQWQFVSVIKEPTHSQEGQELYTCPICGATKTESIPAGGEGEHEFGAWTDSQDGAHHHRDCACGETEIGDHIWDNGVVTTAATHTAEGVRTYTCTVCGGTKTETIPKTTTHAYGKWTDSQDGKTHYRTCACGEVQTDRHDWNSGKITTQPTHTTEGVLTLTCMTCGATKTETIPADSENHTFGNWTDSKDGTHHHRDCACGEIETEEHTWDNGEVTTAATHTATGVRTFTCTVCGATKTETIPADSENHTFGEWTDSKDGTHHHRDCACGETETEEHTWNNGEVTTAATHTATGVRTFTCTVCGATKTETIPADSENHTFGDWTDSKDGTHHHRDCACGETETE
ncbi:MAG: hypothetical protein IKS35_04495, partial [Clostridia bacterium]|nr:hypothetical protein [Clostridia bacterium]